MANQIFQEIIDPQRRTQAIRDNCDEVLPDFSYMRKFTDEEVLEHKEELAENSIELDELKSTIDELKKEYSEKMKPKKTRLKFLLKCLREKAVAIKGECYAMRDEEKYYVYNPEGEEVFSRSLKPSEKQKTVFSVLRNGTDNQII